MKETFHLADTTAWAMADDKNSTSSHPVQFDFDQVSRFDVVDEVAHPVEPTSARLLAMTWSAYTSIRYNGVFFAITLGDHFSFQENELVMRLTHIFLQH
jgi:hypothetical protein